MGGGGGGWRKKRKPIGTGFTKVPLIQEGKCPLTPIEETGSMGKRSKEERPHHLKREKQPNLKETESISL